VNIFSSHLPLSTSSSNHNVDSIVVNLSKTLVYDDPSVNEVKTPQTVEELQPDSMVMLGPLILRLISLPVRKLLKHSRILNTFGFSLKINKTSRFHFFHSNYMVPSLMHWRNLTLQAHMHNISGIPFSCFLACQNQENAYTQHLHIV